MSLADLTEKILAADNFEREKLFTENPQLADINLAFALKEAAYAAWTVEPKKAQDAAAALEILVSFNSDRRILAIEVWIRGIAALTRGENERAVEFLEKAGETWRSVDEHHLAAQTQVAELYALGVVGRYDEAVSIGESALAVFVKFGDELAAGKIEKNLGNLLFRRGLYADSEKYFRSALKRFQTLDDQAELAMIENNLALLKTFQNEFRRAERLYERALERAQKIGLNATEAEIYVSLGNLALFRGRYDEALKSLEKSRQKYAALEMPAPAAIVNLEIAEVYVELNLLNEAATILDRVATQFSELKMQAEEARARALLASAWARLRKNEAALSESTQAKKLYESENNSTGSATVKLIEANLFSRARDYQTARTLSRNAAAVFRKTANWRLFLLAEFLRGEIAYDTKKYKQAAQIFTKVVNFAREKEQPQIVWLCEHALGKIAETTGDESRAEQHFRNAIEIIEKLRSPLVGDEFRTAFFVDKLAPFEKLSAICRKNPERLAESLVWSERARSQALLDLLGNNFETESLATPTNSDNHRELNRLQEELNWFYSRLNRHTTANAAPVAHTEFEETQKDIRRLEREINSLILRLKAVDENALHSFQNFDLRRLQKLLGNKRILLEFTEINGEFGVYVVTNKEITTIENLCRSAQIQQILEQVHFQFGALRYGVGVLKKHLPILKARAKSHLQNLHSLLWQPLKKHVNGKHAVIVPAGVLHYVPFQALHDGEKYLIERGEISYAPSASILQVLLEKKRKKIEKILALGFADERAPQVEIEVLNLQKVMPHAHILIGENASTAALRENLKENVDVLHLACHGQFRADNPLFSSLHLADGWLTVHHVSKLSLHNALVVLSACETGLNEIAPGNELLGLTRGFLQAGANALILTLWTVNDAAASILMTEFYKNMLNADSVAAALRKAQLQLIKQDFHPYFWSPFALVGRW